MKKLLNRGLSRGASQGHECGVDIQILHRLGVIQNPAKWTSYCRMRNEKHSWSLLTTDLTCLLVASAVVLSVFYEVLTALEQVTIPPLSHYP